MNWLLIRGLGRHSKHWGDFPLKLKEQLNVEDQVLCLDLPGINGETTRFKSISDITDHMRQQWLEQKKTGQQWNLCAISLGGMIALNWCSRYPNDFQKLFTINSSEKSTASIFERISPLAVKTLSKLLLNMNPRHREKKVLELTTNNTAITSEMLDRWEKIATDHPLKVSLFLRQLAAAAAFKSPAPQKMTIPYTVLTSKADRFTSYKCSKSLAEKYQAEFFLHETAGHDLPTDDPDWVINHLL